MPLRVRATGRVLCVQRCPVVSSRKIWWPRSRGPPDGLRPLARTAPQPG